MDASMIVAITGAVVGLGGLALNLRGQSAQRVEQQAARAVLHTKTRLDETQQALDAVERRAERAEAGETRERERNDRLEDEIDEERTMRRAMLAAQEARCREALGDMTDAVVTLRAVVRDEVATAAADAALHRVKPHPHTDPEETP